MEPYLAETNVHDEGTSPFTIASIKSLEDVIASGNPAIHAPILLSLARKSEKQVCGIAHSTEEGIILDLEPFNDLAADGSDIAGPINAQSMVNTMVNTLQEARNEPLKEQFQLMCDELRGFLGYDRIMIYQFHEDQHGEVIAESFSKYAEDTFKGLHFPATDIPQANRKIFMSMRSRMIADVGGEAVKVKQSVRLRKDILLGTSQLRGITGCHAQYLSNMGVKATLVLSMVLQDPSIGGMSQYEIKPASNNEELSGERKPNEKLWGLIVCHHYQCAHNVPYYRRFAAEFLVRVFNIQLGRTLQVEQQKLELSLQRHQNVIRSSFEYIEEFGRSRKDIPGVMGALLSREPSATSLYSATNSTGAALIYGDSCVLLGKCPQEEQIKDLVTWLQSTASEQEISRDAKEDTVTFSSARRLPLGGMWSTHCLKEVYPNGEGLKDTASGVLAADVANLVVSRYDGSRNKAELENREGSSSPDHRDQRIVLLWFRGESIMEESWSGDRRKSQARHQGIEMVPRESFKAVKETLEFHSLPWQPHEKNGAAGLQVLIRNTIGIIQHGKLSDKFVQSLENDDGRGQKAIGEFSTVSEELRTVLSTMDLLMIRMSSEFIITEHNKYAASLLLGERRSAVGLTIMNFLDPKSAHILETTVHSSQNNHEVRPLLLRFKLPNHLQGRLEAFQLSKGNSTNNEEYRDLLIFMKFRRNPEGSITGLVFTGHDMSMHGAVMRSLGSSDKGLGVIRSPRLSDGTQQFMHEESSLETDVASSVANIKVPLASVDRNGCVVEWNRLMELATGLDHEHAEGKLLVGDLFSSKGGLLHILSAPTLSQDPVTELTALLVSILSETRNRESIDDKRRMSLEHDSSDSLLLKSMENRVFLRFERAFGGSDSACTGSRATDVMIFFQPILQVSSSVPYSDKDDSGIVSAIMYLVDISLPNTLMKAMSVQMAAETGAEARSGHIAFISHEIRNPLNGILASVEGIHEILPIIHRIHQDSMSSVNGGGDSVKKQMVEIADLVSTTLACSDQLHRTVDDILDLNKLEEGKLILRTSSFAVEVMLQNVILQVKRAAEMKGLGLKMNVSPLLLKVNLIGDMERIQQVLTNFCWNAIKFTAEGSITVEITCELPEGRTIIPQPGVEDKKDDVLPQKIAVFFKVIDTGEGMTQKMLGKVFEASEELDTGTSGVGLAICRSLAELMGGMIHCVSAPGGGSTFVFELPLQVSKRMASSPQLKSRSFNMNLLPGRRSLSEHTVDYSDKSGGDPEATLISLDVQDDQLESILPRRNDLQDKQGGSVRSSNSEKLSQMDLGERDVEPHEGFFVAAAARQAMAQGHNPRKFSGLLPTIKPVEKRLQVKVIREHIVGSKSVAMLVEVCMGDELIQHWGGAEIGDLGIGPAMVAAQNDALGNAMQLLRPDSGISSFMMSNLAEQHKSLGEDVDNPVAEILNPTPSHPVVTFPITPQSTSSTFSNQLLEKGTSLGREGLVAGQQILLRTMSDPISESPPLAESNSHTFPTNLVEGQNDLNRSEPSFSASGQSFLSASAASETDLPALSNVLIVDDDPFNVKVLQRAFAKVLNLEATTGEDGLDVVRMLVNQDQRFDAVLLDENMRHMNGSAAVLELRKHEARTGEMKPQLVIATTGNSATDDRIKYQKAGFNAILCKPLNMSRAVNWVVQLHRFWQLTTLAGYIWKPQDGLEALPRGCPKPDIKKSCVHEDGYFFGEIEVFGTIPAL